MNVVDSSGWLEYFADAPNADFFAEPLEDHDNLIIPAITIYEVFKRILQQRDENTAIKATAVMQQHPIADLTASRAMSAAKLSAELKLPMAHSIILATARDHRAVLWT